MKKAETALRSTVVTSNEALSFTEVNSNAVANAIPLDLVGQPAAALALTRLFARTAGRLAPPQASTSPPPAPRQE